MEKKIEVQLYQKRILIIDNETGRLERTVMHYPKSIGELQQIEDYYLIKGLTVSLKYEKIGPNGVEMMEILRLDDFSEACLYEGVQGLCIFVQRCHGPTPNQPTSTGFWKCLRCMFDQNPDPQEKCKICNNAKPVSRGTRRILF